MKVVIINPTYNEKENIAKLIPILEQEIFPSIKNHDMHILVADDSSPDGTADAVKKLMKQYNNVHLNIGEKHGLGAAYVRAMDYAVKELGADIMFEMDADLQHDPKKIIEFINKIDEGYDMVIGTRYSGGGSIPKRWGLHRKAFSIFGNLLVRTILMRFAIHDWTGGFRALRKEVFLKEKEELTAFRGYTFQVSFLHKAARDGFKIAEVPFSFNERAIGNSKIAPKEYIIDLLKYVIYARILELKRFIKFLIVGTSGFIVQIFVQEVVVRSGLAHAIALTISPIVFAVTRHYGILPLRDGIGGGFGAEAAIISNFMFNNFWTFKDTRKLKERSPFIVRLLKFNFTSIAAILIQASSIWFFVRLLGVNLSIFSINIPTRIVVVIPTIVFIIIPINFLIYNKIIWKTQYLKHEKNLRE